MWQFIMHKLYELSLHSLWHFIAKFEITGHLDCVSLHIISHLIKSSSPPHQMGHTTRCLWTFSDALMTSDIWDFPSSQQGLNGNKVGSPIASLGKMCLDHFQWTYNYVPLDYKHYVNYTRQPMAIQVCCTDLWTCNTHCVRQHSSRYVLIIPGTKWMISWLL